MRVHGLVAVHQLARGSTVRHARLVRGLDLAVDGLRWTSSTLPDSVILYCIGVSSTVSAMVSVNELETLNFTVSVNPSP